VNAGSPGTGGRTLTARYLGQIPDRPGTGGIRVDFPAPRPADGIAQFAGDTAQLGLLVAVMVASSALAFDARREMAVFLRTRVTGVRACSARCSSPSRWAVAAPVASLVNGAVGAAGITLGVLLGMAVFGNVEGAGRRLPTTLLTAMAGLVRDAHPAEYFPTAAPTVLGGGAALAAATVLAARRER
jgi:ABC-2 type transport system permease protein